MGGGGVCVYAERSLNNEFRLGQPEGQRATDGQGDIGEGVHARPGKVEEMIRMRTGGAELAGRGGYMADGERG